MEIVATMTGKGQVTIPKEIRRRLGVETSDKVAFVVSDEGRIELRPARYTVASIRGAVPALPGTTTADFDVQIREAFEAAADEKVRELEGRDVR